MADADIVDDVNVYWAPNIPSSSDTTNVTVYTHRLYPNVNDVILSVKIGDGSWTNHTITANVYDSAEGDAENYYFEIGPQPHGTEIIVRAYPSASFPVIPPLIKAIAASWAPSTMSYTFL